MSDSEFHCSELVKIKTGESEVIGNLERIDRDACTIAVEAPLPVGTLISMQCLDCPRGERSCVGCRFRGEVGSCAQDPALGCFVEVRFEGRKWSTAKWQPRHLTNLAGMKGIEKSPAK